MLPNLSRLSNTRPPPLEDQIPLQVHPKHSTSSSTQNPSERICTWCGQWVSKNLDTVDLWTLSYPIFTSTFVSTEILLFFTVDTPKVLGLGVPVQPGTEWKLVTLVFAHADSAHLLGNVIVTVSLVMAFEIAHGTLRTLAIFWIGGLVGSIAQVLLWDPRYKSLVGSSAAVFSVLGACLAHLVANLQETPLWPVWVLVASITVVVEILTMIVDPLAHVAYEAHVFGAAYGAILGLAIVRNVRVWPWERWVARTSLLVATVAACIAVVLFFASVAY